MFLEAETHRMQSVAQIPNCAPAHNGGILRPSPSTPDGTQLPLASSRFVRAGLSGSHSTEVGEVRVTED